MINLINENIWTNSFTFICKEVFILRYQNFVQVKDRAFHQCVMFLKLLGET
jgi:hypothetical protein